ncbi:MAG: DapH/DapD/GlmU-related protein [Spongiibacteraceae bacterium]
MIRAFLADCQRRNNNTPPTWPQVVYLFLSNYGLQALLGYRLGRHLLQLKQENRGFLLRCIGWPMYWLLSRYARAALDIRLELSADIGAGLFIGHFGNILVDRCKLGEHCTIAQSTRLSADENGAGPQIGNRVWVGGHVVVRGPIQIGDAATVAAGAVVTRNIPGGALCMGNPARVTLMQYDNSEIL